MTSHKLLWFEVLWCLSSCMAAPDLLFLAQQEMRVGGLEKLCIPSLQGAGFLRVFRRVSEVYFLPQNADLRWGNAIYYR